MVKVACTIPNGINIRLYQQGFDDGTGDGVKQMVHDGVGMRLNGTSALDTGAGATHRKDLPPGETEVDGEWWAKWLKQNERNPMVTLGHIYEIPEEASPKDPPEPVPEPA